MNATPTPEDAPMATEFDLTAAIAKAVKAERLRLADIVHEYGDLSVTDYARGLLHSIAESIRKEASSNDA